MIGPIIISAITKKINVFINPSYIATTTAPIIVSIRNTKINITLNLLIIPPFFRAIGRRRMPNGLRRSTCLPNPSCRLILPIQQSRYSTG